MDNKLNSQNISNNTAKNKAIFFDRDGTLNYDSAYVYKVEDLRILDWVEEWLLKLKNLWYKLIIISNQSWIWRWYFTIEDCNKFNEELQKQLWIKFDWIYICPHTPDEDCKCRKPKTLLIEKAVQDFELDIDQCFFVWDKECDIQTWINTWCRTVLIKNDQYECNIEPDFSFNSVFEFASKLKE